MKCILLTFIVLAVVDAQIAPWGHVPMTWPAMPRAELTTNLGTNFQLKPPRQQKQTEQSQKSQQPQQSLQSNQTVKPEQSKQSVKPEQSKESEKKEVTWQDWFAAAVDMGSDAIEDYGLGKLAYHPQE